MQKTFLILGALLGGSGVVLGAFGAHGLKKLVGAETVGTYQTGVQYQMYHAFALIIIGVLFERAQSNYFVWAGWLFFSGIILFSGSLYLLASLKAMNKVGISGIGIITPIGGLLFVLGWLMLLVGLLKK